MNAFCSLHSCLSRKVSITFVGPIYLQIHLREFDNTPYSAIEMAETDIDAVPVVNPDARGTNAVASAAS